MDVYAVIGAGYGDEGKGRLVDALAAQVERCRVVRFNGGAQAGHTVQLDQHRHVFHHFGSGTFAGAQTHLSRHFVVNPILALQEYQRLSAMGWEITTSIDPNAPVTTPFEMMINQALEAKRGQQRHGSCGLGFGETWEREESGFGLVFSDVFDDPIGRLKGLWKNWVPRRCAVLGLDVDMLPFQDTIALRFVEEWKTLMGLVRVREDGELSTGVDRIIFEGAQGLGLDQTLGAFPHVTRSFTGSPNVSDLAQKAGLDSVDALYITRSYATRHGAGPFDEEKHWVGPVIADPTNRPNPWQGTLRFAPIDCDKRGGDIVKDCARATVSWQPSLVVTCLDQEVARPVLDDSVPVEQMGEYLSQRWSLPLFAEGWGPERSALIFRI